MDYAEIAYTYEACQKLINSDPGTIIIYNKEKYVRLVDMPNRHLEDFFCNTQTGHIKHASYLFRGL